MTSPSARDFPTFPKSLATGGRSGEQHKACKHCGANYDPPADLLLWLAASSIDDANRLLELSGHIAREPCPAVIDCADLLDSALACLAQHLYRDSEASHD